MQEPERPLPIFFLLVGLYAAGGAYSSLMLDGPGGVALFWPASGIALAGVVRYGLRWALFVPLGGLLAHLLFDPVSLAFLPYSLASNYAAVLAGGWLVLRPPRQQPLTVMFGLRALLAGCTMALVSACIGILGLFQTGEMALEVVPAAGIRWFLGDLLGVVSVAPAVLIALSRNDPRMPRTDSTGYAPETEQLLWNISITASLVSGWAMRISAPSAS